MSQMVSNSAERRNAIIRFTSLFLLTVVVACFAYLRLFYVKTEIPKQELQQFKDIAPVLENIVKYGESLKAYEDAITSNPVAAPRLQSDANNKSVEIHSMLYGLEKSPNSTLANNILSIGDEFFNSLKSSEAKFLAIQKELDDCKRGKERLEEDINDLKDKLTKKEEDLSACNEKVSKCKKW